MRTEQPRTCRHNACDTPVEDWQSECRYHYAQHDTTQPAIRRLPHAHTADPDWIDDNYHTIDPNGRGIVHHCTGDCPHG